MTHFRELRDIRNSGAGVNENSCCHPLANLLKLNKRAIEARFAAATAAL